MKNRLYIIMLGMLLMMGVSVTSSAQIIKGKVFGGGQLAQVNGGTAEAACNVTISSGSVYGKVYGAGEGVKVNDIAVTAGTHADVAKVTGNVKVNLEPGHEDGGTAWQDVFGGGALAKVDGSTYVNMTGGHIAANLFGGGEGDITDSHITYADVTKNTNVDISGGDAIWDRTSMTSSSSTTDTYFTFTKKTPDTETYETKDAEATTATVETYFESLGYTNVSVTGPTGPTNGVYTFSVTHDSKETYTYSKAGFDSLPQEIKDKLSNTDVYKKTETTEDRPLAEGEIVYWDTSHREKDYKNEDNPDHKIHNELFYDEEKKTFEIEHNIFGGGHIACNVGTYDAGGVLTGSTGLATVSLTKGLFGADLTTTDQWKDSFKDDVHPHFYVFGGGLGENTKVGNTDVTVDIEGEYGDYTYEVDEPTEQLARPRKALAKPDDKLPIFDNTYGIPDFTVLGVLGGGYAGTIHSNTKVTVDGKTFLRRIYGGGFGEQESTADNTTGQVGGNTDVNVIGAHTYGDVFGGGAGVTSTTVDLDNVARVLGKTSVTVADDANIYGKVYGGGDMACVGVAATNETPRDYATSVSSASTKSNDTWTYSHSNHQTFLNILGGNIYGEIYGGGKGVKNGEANDYTKVGRIEGNTLIHIANSVYDEENDIWNVVPEATTDATVPNVWSRIYGGCAYGTVDGNTMVHTEGGMLGLNIFGGGYGDVVIQNDQTDNTSGASTASATLDQVLGRMAAGDDKVTYANVLGNTKVQIDGGSWIWNRKADTNGNITTWEDANKVVTDGLEGFKRLVAQILQAKSVEDLEKIEAVKSISPDFFNLNTRQFFKNHNIFGGGNRACSVGTYNNEGNPVANTGTSEVIINHSPIAIIKDGKGNDINMLNQSTVAGLCWYLGINNVAHPQFSVFGAGYGANTKVGNAIVKAQPGIQLDKDGGLIGEGKYINEESDLFAYLAFDDQIAESWNNVSPDDRKKYYGLADENINSANTYMRYHASQLAWSLGAPNFTFMDIHGGGFSGYVVNDTKVETDCQLTVRNIFGAGLGYKPYGLTAETTQTAADAFNFGQVGGNSSVFVKSGIVSLNVYGGGAGVESYSVTNDATTKTDFPNIALVKGKTNVDVYGETIKIPDDFTYAGNLAGKRLERTIIFGGIYGGGDVANVGAVSTTEGNEKTATSATQVTGDNKATYIGGATSTVNIRGGSIQSQIYAGGNGRQANLCSITITGEPSSPTYGYKRLGAIYGNTHITVAGADMCYPYESDIDKTTATQDAPHIWNRIYGGCQNGTVYGNTLVEINGGSLGHNIFGGGFGNDGTNLGQTTGDDDNDLMSGTGRAISAITSADVTGNTNIIINGGEMELTSYWLPESRTWEPATIKNGTTYSPQYDPDKRKFKINHNTYGGGNAACVVGGSTYITMNKGLLKNTTVTIPGSNTTDFFSLPEWKEVYQKVGSPQFALFGGGYGAQTNISSDTHILTATNPDNTGLADFIPESGYKHFKSEMAVMDIVGGGYSGKVTGKTHVNATQGIFARRIFGGGYLGTVGKTNITFEIADCYDVFGGGLMGDVEESTNITIGSQTKEDKKDTWIHGNIYGGNDVSGYINMSYNNDGYFKENSDEGGTNINIYGGNIDGNVYGAGNGDYLYALDRAGNDKVTVNEHYPLDPDDPNSQQYDLVYTVPMRETMPSYKAASDAAKIVNINSWRPLTNRVNITIMGQPDDAVKIKGDVYGGGNSATVQKVYNSGNTAMTGDVTFDIGSHVNIGRVFMGCNGDALFTASEDNAYLADFQKLNDLQLDAPIDWETDPSNHGISTLYLPTENEHRPLIYPHLLDLYFHPVEMDIQAKLKWAGKDELVDPQGELTNCTIGTFCCGGNRGNMNVYPETTGAKAGNVIDYIFPKNLTITEKIIGGCNNANYEWFNSEKNTKIFHEGGYLLGEGHTTYPFIKLTVQNQFNPAVVDGAYKGGNVYGGCFETGTIRGDITVDMKSDMLAGKTKATLERSNELLGSNPAYAALNVYGAGYGMESYVYGNTNVLFGEGVSCTAPTSDATFNATGVSANFVYGGGQQGNVIGVTNVDVLNGHIYKSVTGGSYSGYVYGSTQIKVGYPVTYTLNPGYAGRYLLKRTDVNNLTVMNTDADGNETPVIKQYINLIPGDVITEGVYEAISAKYNGEDVAATDISTTKSDYFSSATPTPSVGWDNINIYIDEACYGGGYSLAQGSSVMANNTTVLKYTDDYNINNTYRSGALADLVGGDSKGTTAGFGGNTMILIGDATSKPAGATNDRDHITISKQVMQEAAVSTGTDLYGYYYQDKTDAKKYHYIYQAGTYYKDGNMPQDAATDGKVYRFDAEGGIFGDGHLSYAEGFRAADVTGYGYADYTVESPKKINTFQRMDILRLTDNCFSLLGARDYTVNEISTTPYSMARVGEIQMISSIDDSGNLPTMTTTTGAAPNTVTTYNKRSRNFLGFSNNIHYVGAVYSNTDFKTTLWHNASGALGGNDDKFTPVDGSSDITMTNKSYEEVKQAYINDYYQSDKHTIKQNASTSNFQQRNDGTAKNMIGIASGYALKIQNVKEIYETNDAGVKKMKEDIYYGPIFGVVEVNLIDVREDEGGGYVYADNIHKRTANDGSDEDFLETTGNFVFPYNSADGRHVVDDCFPTGYDVHVDDKTTPEAKADVHYWYVTGYNYFYHAHITGYTYDSSTNELYFDMNNSDGLMKLSGALSGQTPKVYSITWRSGHTGDGYSCAMETESLNPQQTSQPDKGGIFYQKYNLGISAAREGVYSDAQSAYYHMPFYSQPHNDSKEIFMAGEIPQALTSDANIGIRLWDKDNNSGTDFYNNHLKQPCEATIILTLDAYEYDKEDNTKQVRKDGYIGIQYFYTYDEKAKQYNQVTTGTIAINSSNNNKYYYYNSVLNRYTPISDITKMYTRNGSDYTPMPTDAKMTMGTSTTYYYHTNREYTYTIYLTIDYVQGPTINGHINVENCALPGEMVRVNKKDVNIESDQSFAADGYYWRIGKRVYEDDEWHFEDTTPWEKASATTAQAIGYDTYMQTEQSGTGKGFFQGSNYNKTGDYLDIPAYYYMNGYGIQLGISMTGLDPIFPVQMREEDQFVVHNYHHMLPRGSNNVNLHLAEAVARTKAESGTFAEPRIYINDTQDLAAFVAFLDSVGTANGTIAANAKEYVKLGASKATQKEVDEGKATKVGDWIPYLCEVPRYGEHAQFVVQNDLNIPNTYKPAANFAGILHGNGHVFTGLAKDKYIFSENEGNIYNLGMASGKIANSSNTDAYHCCFEYYTDSEKPRNVYRMNGDCITDYTEDDFRYGKVAYDLNQYYLDKRYVTGGADYTLAAASSAANYVENYFANGDYQYARQSDVITGANTGITYLRTGQLNAEPNYGSNETRHDKTHAIDKARAQGYVAAVPAVEEVSHKATEADVTAGKAENVGDKVIDTPASPSVPESRTDDYLPLFNSPQQTDGLGLTEPMNDYLFWGQDLQQKPAAYPATIESHQNSAMINRVYRAAGYYRSTQLDGYYYNAYNLNSRQMGTYVHNQKTTAIDFTCKADGNTPIYSNGTKNDYATEGIGTYGGGSIFYSPVADNAPAFASFTVSDGVTKNLLVYTSNAEDESSNCYSVVNTALRYDTNTLESNIKGHHVVEDGSLSTPYLHLVERATESAPNNDFCCPIAFKATERAWYTRKPLYYAESNNDAWEGICLPFTVQKTEASLNGEITHFYGTPNSTKETTDGSAVAANLSNVDPNKNYHTLHHEYWLRGLTAVTDGTGETAGKKVSTFSRPGTESGLFNPKDQSNHSLVTPVSYTFKNDFFKNTYEDRHNYNYGHEGDGDWYLNSHTYSDYLPLTQGIPYIVSFPGNRYYEFDLSSQFYNEMLKKYGSAQAPAQAVTYNAYGTEYDVPALTDVAIPVSKAIETTANGYVHTGTFLATDNAPYGMNAIGTAFVDEINRVLPFRTYMSQASSSARLRKSTASRTIAIGEGTDTEQIYSAPDSDPSEGITQSGMWIYPDGSDIVIESTYSATVRVHTISGQTIRILEVSPGTNTYSGIPSGIYIVGGKKLHLH